MGIEDLTNKAKDALSSEQGEHASDQGIQGAGDGADRLSGGRFAEQTDGVQERADGFLGGGDGDAARAQPQDGASRH